MQHYYTLEATRILVRIMKQVRRKEAAPRLRPAETDYQPDDVKTIKPLVINGKGFYYKELFPVTQLQSYYSCKLLSMKRSQLRKPQITYAKKEAI